MIIVKREFADLDPNDTALQYRYDRDVAAEKLLGEWSEIRSDMEENGQKSPIQVDRIYDEDFNLRVTYVTDGFRRWIAAKADELNLPVINAIVTIWVDCKNAIQIKPTTVSDVDSALISLRTEFDHQLTGPDYDVREDTPALLAEKNPPDLPDQETWLGQNPGLTAEDYASAVETHTAYQQVWSTVDAYIEANGQPEQTIQGVREMHKSGPGDFYFRPIVVTSREDSLAVVSCRERGITIAEVEVRTIDRTGTQPG